MEYNKTFALVEAVVLIGLFAWLYYINSLGPRSGSDSKDQDQDQNRPDDS